MDAPWYREALACPDCGAGLALSQPRCACGFTIRNGTPLDLRPQHPQPRLLTFALDVVSLADLDDLPLDKPRITYDGPPATRDSSELFSAAQPWLKRGARFLDLGCGPRDQATPATHHGLEYVGIDFDSSNADILADGHAIPFRDATFDVVLAYAVLEHLQNPFVALHEVARVLKPGGIFFGAVSQGEPYHVSFFHHTPLGVASVFRAADLKLLRIWPSYDTLHSLATMGRYAKAVRALIEVVHRVDRAFPFLAPRQFLRASRREKELEALFRAASICFVASKS